MVEEGKKSSEKKPADEPYSFLKVALSGIAIFAGVSYVLGRFYTEAYYSALGMSRGLLSFSPDYYMFSSVDLVIICVIVVFYLYRYYSLMEKGGRRFLAFPLYPDWKDREKKVRDIIAIVLAIGLTVWILVSLYSGKGFGGYLPGAIGIVVGVALGISTSIFMSFLSWIVRTRVPYTVLYVGALILIGCWLPSISGNLAEIKAKVDMERFPKAVLICEDTLNAELQSCEESPKESVEVRIITTNNDMTYVLKEDVDLADEWQVYAIRNDNIETIIFAEKSG